MGVDDDWAAPAAGLVSSTGARCAVAAPAGGGGSARETSSWAAVAEGGSAGGVESTYAHSGAHITP